VFTRVIGSKVGRSYPFIYLTQSALIRAHVEFTRCLRYHHDAIINSKMISLTLNWKDKYDETVKKKSRLSKKTFA